MSVHMWGSGRGSGLATEEGDGRGVPVVEVVGVLGPAPPVSLALRLLLVWRTVGPAVPPWLGGWVV